MARRFLDPGARDDRRGRPLSGRTATEDPDGSRTRAVFFDVDFTLIYPGPDVPGRGLPRLLRAARHRTCDPARSRPRSPAPPPCSTSRTITPTTPALFIRYIRHIIEQMGGVGPGASTPAPRRSTASGRLPPLLAVRRRAARRCGRCGARGLLIGLISNTHRSLETFAEPLRARRARSSAAVSSCEHGYNKPHPSIFRTALRLLACCRRRR